MKLFLNVENHALKGALLEIFEDVPGYDLVAQQDGADFILCDHALPQDKTFLMEEGSPISFESLLRALEKRECQELIPMGRLSYNARLRKLEDTAAHTFQTLTEKEGALLMYFWKQKGQDVSREALVKDIWGYHEDVDSHTLETHIYRLRQKIETDPKAPELLVTTPGGYVFKA